MEQVETEVTIQMHRDTVELIDDISAARGSSRNETLTAAVDLYLQSNLQEVMLALALRGLDELDGDDKERVGEPA